MSEIWCEGQPLHRVGRVDDHGDGVQGHRVLHGLEAVGRAASISSGLISREALAMSTVPLISAAMPVPEPPPVTEMRTSGRAAM